MDRPSQAVRNRKEKFDMKKILAALLAVCMLLTAAVSMAEGAAVTEVNWSDLEAGAAE